MARPIVQIYEIQTPEEARSMLDLGVDHIGSVVTSRERRHDPVIRETVSTVSGMGGISSLIPLYTDPDAVLDTIDYYRPHIVHFCDRLEDSDGDSVAAALALQAMVKHHFRTSGSCVRFPSDKRGWPTAGSCLTWPSAWSR